MGLFKWLGDLCDDITADNEADRQISRNAREMRLSQSRQSLVETQTKLTEAAVVAATSQRTASSRVSEAELEAQRRVVNLQTVTEVEKWTGRTQIASAQADLQITAYVKQRQYIDAQTRLLEAQAEQQFYRELAGMPAEERTELLDAYAQQQKHLYIAGALRDARLNGTVPASEALQAAQSIRSNTIPGIGGPRPSDQDIERIARQAVVQARSLLPDQIEAFWHEFPAHLLTRYPDLVAQEIVERANELRNMPIMDG